jgi:hypothetical protein
MAPVEAGLSALRDAVQAALLHQQSIALLHRASRAPASYVSPISIGSPVLRSLSKISSYHTRQRPTVLVDHCKLVSASYVGVWEAENCRQTLRSVAPPDPSVPAACTARICIVFQRSQLQCLLAVGCAFHDHLLELPQLPPARPPAPALNILQLIASLMMHLQMTSIYQNAALTGKLEVLTEAEGSWSCMPAVLPCLLAPGLTWAVPAPL